MDFSVNHSFRECRRLTRRCAKSFYFASHLLPQDKRNAAYALYAFCRYVDDCVDGAKAGADVEAALKQARKWVQEANRSKQLPVILSEATTQSKDRGEGGSTCPSAKLAHPILRLRSPMARSAQDDTAWLPAFQETVRRWKIPGEVLNTLLDGMAMDRSEKIRMPDWATLENYCYHVASVVGLAMLPILAGPNASEEMLARLKPQAAALGTAMQLTNILRDVGEDWQRDRIYLPADELAEEGLSESDIGAGCTDERWQRFLAKQIARARQFYAKADSGIDALPTDGSRQTARLMRVLYSEILSEIERNSPHVFAKRAHVPLWRKCWLAIRNQNATGRSS